MMAACTTKPRIFDGVTYDPAISMATMRAIRQFAVQEDVVLLPSHDPDAVTRLHAKALCK